MSNVLARPPRWDRRLVLRPVGVAPWGERVILRAAPSRGTGTSRA